mmetsp:Transcript_3274/g.7798  ORF Transcript_3274/g.7798 Transcript_3274/m.7798 type:complete len:269 (-) Transcript_3274:118-924(-)
MMYAYAPAAVLALAYIVVVATCVPRGVRASSSDKPSVSLHADNKLVLHNPIGKVGVRDDGGAVDDVVDTFVQLNGRITELEQALAARAGARVVTHETALISTNHVSQKTYFSLNPELQTVSSAVRHAQLWQAQSSLNFGDDVKTVHTFNSINTQSDPPGVLYEVEFTVDLYCYDGASAKFSLYIDALETTGTGRGSIENELSESFLSVATGVKYGHVRGSYLGPLPSKPAIYIVVTLNVGEHVEGQSGSSGHDCEIGFAKGWLRSYVP